MPPRPLRPKNEPAVPGSSDVGDIKAGKRRAVSSACIPCRRRKSKCDGQIPACSTCVAVYRTQCVYEADSDHRRKGALKRDIQSLQERNDALDVIVASLRSLSENDSIALWQTLRSDASFEGIAESLRGNVRLPPSFAAQTLEADFAQQVTPPTSSRSYDDASHTSSISRESSGDTMSMSASSSESHVAAWFRTPQDADLVDHLLNMYFSWIHPFYHFLSRDHFLQDMRRGRTDFCSALLVNALLSFACHYSDRAAARTDPTDPATAGDHFYAEAKRLLDRDERSCLTTVQALGIMSLRESSAARDSSGYRLAGRCVRMALELGLHLTVLKNGLKPMEAEVRKLVFWAVFNLETQCAVGFGRLSQLPCSAADIEALSANLRSETQNWRPYEDVNIPRSPTIEEPARGMLFQDQLSRLCELANDMVNTFYAPRERFTSRRLAVTYAQYQAWHQNLPEVFRLGNTSLPHVLVLHMFYHGCVLHLFRPYIRLDLRGANLFPRETCTFCANEISALINAIRAMYGLRRVCFSVVNLLLSASTIHLLNLPSEPALSHLSQGIHDLEAMATNHGFAARAVEIIRSLAAKWHITLPEGAATMNMYRDTGDRRASDQPSVSSPPQSTFFAASISRKHSGDDCELQSAGSTDEPQAIGQSWQDRRQSDTQSQQEQENKQQHQQHPQHQHQHQQQLHQQQPQQSFFSNPQLQQQHPLQTTMPAPTFYSDVSLALDSAQVQSAFWTPFPSQGMPMHQMRDRELLNLQRQSHLSQFDPNVPTLLQSWPSTGEVGPRRLSGTSEEEMGGMPSWGWQ